MNIQFDDGKFRERVYTADYSHEIRLVERCGDDPIQGVVLELTVDVGDEELTVQLDDYHLHELVLALGRYERMRKREV